MPIKVTTVYVRPSVEVLFHRMPAGWDAVLHDMTANNKVVADRSLSEDGLTLTTTAVFTTQEDLDGFKAHSDVIAGQKERADYCELNGISLTKTEEVV